MLSACVYLPRSTQVFDPDCRIVANPMVLEEVQVAAIHQCVNQGCIALVIGASAVSAASIVISGSVVVAGNIADGLERRIRCRREP